MTARAALVLGSAVVALGTSVHPVTFAQTTNTLVLRQAKGVPKFDVDPGWPGKLPDNWIMGVPSSVAVDRRDHVWILTRPATVPAEQRDHAAPPVIEFDASGRFVQAWGGPAEGYEWPDNEHGITVDYTDHVWIGGIGGWVAPFSSPSTPRPSRSDDMLLKFTTQGRLVLQIGNRSKSAGNTDTRNFNYPADVDVYPSTNEAFVADGYGNRRLIVLDADTGAFKRMWGAFGNAPLNSPAWPRPSGGDEIDGPGSPQFGVVHGVKVSNDGLVYVADRHNRRIQVFSTDGKYIAQMFVNRSSVDSILRNFASVGGLALSPDPTQKFLYASDFDNSQIVIIDRKALTVVGAFGVRGSAPGSFNNVHHLAVDSKGNIYTAEVAGGRRVQKFVVKSTS